MRHVASAPHEWVSNYVYHDLDSFFACNRVIKDGGGCRTGRFELDGENWEAKLYYQGSGLKHPGSRLPTGTRFEIETLREYRFKVKRRSDEDPSGEQSFNAHLAPR